MGRFSIFMRCAKNLSIFDFHAMRKKFVDFRFSCDAQKICRFSIFM